MKSIPLFLIASLIFTTSCSNAQHDKEKLSPATVIANSSPFKNQLGINGFEWNFSNDNQNSIAPERLNAFKSFGSFRHYMEWGKLEPEEGKYSFNPTRSGGWMYDNIYKSCKDQGIEVLSCLKGCPEWLMNTYPKDQRDGENVPAPYGLDKSKPSSYLKQAKMAFQFTARYGRNRSVSPSLLSVYAKPRWTYDSLNTVKIGLNYVKYIECDNERDKEWKGPKAHQTAEEYAANMSAFYDGDKGKLGKNAGVKTADPSMIVVMGGLSNPDTTYVIKMIEWCKKNRGYKKDGSVNLCFDIINYHWYNNNRTPHKDPTVGKAPELCNTGDIADNFVQMAKRRMPGMEVWNTESGYDVNPHSPQRAIPIGKKSVLITQADWILRSAFLYERHGLKRSFFYMYEDISIDSWGPYGSSGFAKGPKKRPVADYFSQTKQLMGNFHFLRNLNTDPIVDLYVYRNRKIYVLYIPDEIGRTKTLNLNLGKADSAKVYTLQPGSSKMSVATMATVKGSLKLTVTETPVFVEKN